MNHTISILGFLQYFGLGLVAFVILLQALLASRRLRLYSQIRRRFRRQEKPVFVEVYRVVSFRPSQARRDQAS